MVASNAKSRFHVNIVLHMLLKCLNSLASRNKHGFEAFGSISGFPHLSSVYCAQRLDWSKTVCIHYRDVANTVWTPCYLVKNKPWNCFMLFGLEPVNFFKAIHLQM